jgi:hypothetical protein
MAIVHRQGKSHSVRPCASGEPTRALPSEKSLLLWFWPGRNIKNIFFTNSIDLFYPEWCPLEIPIMRISDIDYCACAQQEGRIWGIFFTWKMTLLEPETSRVPYASSWPPCVLRKSETISLPMASRAIKSCISSLGGVPIRMFVANCAPRPRLQVLAMCQPLKNNAITMRK